LAGKGASYSPFSNADASWTSYWSFFPRTPFSFYSFHSQTMTPRVLVLVGLPGSGKSTFSNKLIQCRPVSTLPRPFWVKRWGSVLTMTWRRIGDEWTKMISDPERTVNSTCASISKISTTL
jgi:ABC-type glutathione transport system ATPase component